MDVDVSSVLQHGWGWEKPSRWFPFPESGAQRPCWSCARRAAARHTAGAGGALRRGTSPRRARRVRSAAASHNHPRTLVVHVPRATPLVSPQALTTSTPRPPPERCGASAESAPTPGGAMPTPRMLGLAISSSRGDGEPMVPASPREVAAVERGASGGGAVVRGRSGLPAHAERARCKQAPPLHARAPCAHLSEQLTPPRTTPFRWMRTVRWPSPPQPLRLLLRRARPP